MYNLRSRCDTLPESSGTIELRFSLFNPENKTESFNSVFLSEKWNYFIKCQQQLKNASKTNDDALGLSDDAMGSDSEDDGNISVREYERLVDSLASQRFSRDDDSDMTSEYDDEGFSSENDSSISDESDIEQDSAESPAQPERNIPKRLYNDSERGPNPLNRQDSSLLPRTPKTLEVPTVTKEKKRNRIRRRRKSRKQKDKRPIDYFEFNARSQVVGITYLEIVSCSDLPPLSNMMRTSFDMDPFVVVSFGKKTFRTGHIRHTLNPVFNEDLTFPVLNHEKGFSINFTVMDKDKITLNDNVATADFPIVSILETSPKPNPVTFLYDLDSLYTHGSYDSSTDGLSTSISQLQKSSNTQSEHSYESQNQNSGNDQNVAQSSTQPASVLYKVQDIGNTNSSFNQSASVQSNSALKNFETVDHSTVSFTDPVLVPLAQSSRSSSTSAPSFSTPDDTVSSPNTMHTPFKRSSLNDTMGVRSRASSVQKDTASQKSSKSTEQGFKMIPFSIPLTLLKTKSNVKNYPVLEIKARFIPYAALRQQFWRGLIRLFDADDSNSMNIIEISTMLEQLGATLSPKTVEGFFSKFGKSNDEELSIDELVMCLEEQILKDTANQQRGHNKHNSEIDNVANDGSVPIINIQNDFDNRSSKTGFKQQSVDEKNDEYVIDVDGFPAPSSHAICNQIQDKDISKEKQSTEVIGQTPAEEDGSDEDERIIRVVACPFCGQPRLDKKTEVDIVTHLATCANQDWSHDNLKSMRNFVSSNQARKRWYTKIMFKVTYGNYKLGANSANILVQDRLTGFIQEEKMNAYVRLGIRLLYKGLKSSSMESTRICRILKNASIKQGLKYDNLSSASAIEPFINFYQLNMDEVLLPFDKFKTFNQFFYRELKPGSRVCDAPNDNRIAVSPADCRSTYFPSITRATEIWVKGTDFSIQNLFGNAYPEMVDTFVNGSLAIFRLAPQDYHRFHIPVSGVLGEPKTIEGKYYTVNPMAIRSALDVYGENVRVLVPIQSDEFGLVMIVCVGAMMVGSTVITRKAGERVERMDELGYFQFGGSTVLVLFEPNRIKFDGDLEQNSEGALETLVKVGMSIGHTLDTSEYELDYKSKTKSPLSPDQIAEMKKKANLSGGNDDSNTFIEGGF